MPRRALWFVGGLVAVLAAIVLLLNPRPSTLPPGATRMALLTEPNSLLPPLTLGCPMAMIAPVRLRLQDNTLLFISSFDDRPVSIIWPRAWSSRLLKGRAELVTPDGVVFARDGDVIENLAGSSESGGFRVCIDGAPGLRPAVETGEPISTAVHSRRWKRPGPS